jgi:hypothetical protein
VLRATRRSSATRPTPTPADVGDGSDGGVGYYLDVNGLIHLTGRAEPSTDNENPNQIFTLPRTFAPANRVTFVGECPCGFAGAPGVTNVIVGPDGTVEAFAPETSLDGITLYPGE